MYECECKVSQVFAPTIRLLKYVSVKLKNVFICAMLNIPFFLVMNYIYKKV